MTDTQPNLSAGAHGTVDQPDAKKRARASAVWMVVGMALLYREALGRVFAAAVVENWSTIFLSLTLQATPFLVLGVVLSAAIHALVPPALLARLVPARPVLAIPAAGLAGAFLPGCECSSVPVAGRLVARGVPQAAALTFLLAAPAINPVVVVSTAVAFRGRGDMVVARFVASLLAAIVVGAIWSRFASPDFIRSRLAAHAHTSRWRAFVDVASSDFVQAGGFLVLGTMLVATLQTFVPRGVLDDVGGHAVASIFVLAVLAVVLSICSEADAFVAAGLTQFSLTSRLVFLVVGPMVDLKLVALQIGTFGRRFTVRFAPLTFVVAIVVAVVVARLVL